MTTQTESRSQPGADTNRFAEFFDYGVDIEVQMSRHRFVMAGVPTESERWERCKAEYRLIKRAIEQAE